jgi:hypothetical protein
MTEAKKKQLFIENCFTTKELICLTEPMNSRHEDMFRAFKIALELSHEM